jgi:hypothetical protein
MKLIIIIFYFLLCTFCVRSKINRVFRNSVYRYLVISGGNTITKIAGTHYLNCYFNIFDI